MPGTSERDTVPRLGAVAALDPGDPRRIGRYVLSGRLGSGGMGTVYLGRAEGGGPPVAVKVVHPELVGDAGFRARFADEVAAARRVAPFCTARVLDADPAASPPYLVTEFVDGVPLGTTVAEAGPLDESTLYGVALGVAAALAAVHAAGVVHRDLKPANVLLSLSGPRVIDFGIARALDSAQQHTQVGTLIGTPGWMAPEQFRGGKVGPASDVFSWGSLVAYAATGRNPWGGDGPPTALAHRILHGQPDLAGLAGPLRRHVEAALTKDPGRRPTARQLVDALLGGQRMGTSPLQAPDPAVAASRLVERTWTRLPVPAGRGRGPVPTVRAPGPTVAVPAARPAPTMRAAAPTRVAPPAPAPQWGRRPGGPPPPPPATPPPPLPRKRRWYRKKRWLVPLGLLLAYALIPHPGAGPTALPTTTSRPSDDLNQPVRDGQLEFVVSGWRCGVRRLGEGGLARKPKGTYCLATVSASNIGDQSRTLLEPFQKLRDKGDATYEADFAARFYVRGQTLWDPIGPGERGRGTMAFDVPAGADPARLELHDGPLSRGARVRLP